MLTKYKDECSWNECSKIPLLNDDLIFAFKKQEFINIGGCKGFINHILLNTFISIKEYLNGGNIYIDKNLKCGTINFLSKQTYDPLSYFVNMYKIIYLFFNETKYLYEDLLKNEINKINDKLNINELIALAENELYEIKMNLPSVRDMSYFLKNINRSQNE